MNREEITAENELAFQAMQQAIDMCNQVAPDAVESCIASISEDVSPYGTYIVNATTGKIELNVSDIPEDVISVLDDSILPLGCTDSTALNYDPEATISGICEYAEGETGLMSEENRPLMLIGGAILLLVAFKLLK